MCRRESLTPLWSVLSHLGQISLPNSGLEIAGDCLNFSDANNFGKSRVHSRGISSRSKNLDSFLEQLLLQHKICAFHAMKLDLTPDIHTGLSAQNGLTLEAYAEKCLRERVSEGVGPTLTRSQMAG